MCILEEVGILIVPLHFITSFSITLNEIKSVRFILSTQKERKEKKKKKQGMGSRKISTLIGLNVLEREIMF